MNLKMNDTLIMKRFSSQAFLIFIYICSSVTGILFAILCIEAQKRNFFRHLDSKSYLLKSNSMMLVFGISSVFGIVDVGIFFLTCDSKTECLHVHPFIAIVPVSLSKLFSLYFWGVMKSAAFWTLTVDI